MANVLIHKKNMDNVFSNYRPISVLPIVSFERVIHNQLYKYFIELNQFFDSQYGFRCEHSTELAALEIVDRLIVEMDNKEIPLNVYLDLLKGFDKLDHQIFLEKLESYGLRGTSFI